jgi:hypothetical protein
MNHEIHEAQKKILFKEECFAIQGAVFEVGAILVVAQCVS